MGRDIELKKDGQLVARQDYDQFLSWTEQGREAWLWIQETLGREIQYPEG